MVEGPLWSLVVPTSTHKGSPCTHHVLKASLLNRDHSVSSIHEIQDDLLWSENLLIALPAVSMIEPLLTGVFCCFM